MLSSRCNSRLGRLHHHAFRPKHARTRVLRSQKLAIGYVSRASAPTFSSTSRSIPGKRHAHVARVSSLATQQNASPSTPAHSSGVSSSSTCSIDFDNPEIAFHSKSTMDLLRSAFVFKLCTIEPLVKNSGRLLHTSYRMLGESITNTVIRHTFFEQFVGGESDYDLQPAIAKLRKLGVGTVLDYAAEADMEEVEEIAQPEAVAMMYDADIEEAECDKNVKTFLKCIDSAAMTPGGFAAMKVTALGRPILLERVTEIIRATRALFRKFDKNNKRAINFSQFSSTLAELGVEMNDKEARDLFDRFDLPKSGEIDVYKWTEYLRIEDLQYRPFFIEGNAKSEKGLLPYLNAQELERFEAMMGRLNEVCDYAAKKKVRLMVDAEQTYFQPAIDHSVVLLQRKYNREFPVIFGTYQCYLKDVYRRIRSDLDRAKRENFIFACKVVRGAYMVAERQRAKDLGYSDPIQDNIEDTHRCYHAVLDLMFNNLDRCNVMIASHNQNSIKYATELMNSHGIDKKNGGVFFGQLLGMSDHLSFTLGHHGYNAFKYVPYGPIKEVLPYLIRRAEENSSFDGLMTGERLLVKNELKRRLTHRLGRSSSSAQFSDATSLQYPAGVTKTHRSESPENSQETSQKR